MIKLFWLTDLIFFNSVTAITNGQARNFVKAALTGVLRSVP